MVDKALETDNNEDSYGVLLSDQIQFYQTESGNTMIDPFDPKEHLQAASYDVSLGEQYERNGIRKKLKDDNPTLTLRPHEAVVVSTMESLNMPRFLIGRWNPKVTKLFEGIVWVGGVHIDPGFKGKLFVPIYNLSKKEVHINKGTAFASIDFVKTTKYDSAKCKQYKGKEKNELSHSGSGLEDVRREADSFSRKIERYQSINFTILGILIAVISIIAVIPFAAVESGIKFPSTDLYIITMAMSISAVALAAISLFISRSKGERGV